MNHKIDDAAYAKGRELFASGGTVRDLFSAASSLEMPKSAKRDADEFSTAIGFVDAFIDRVRSFQNRRV